MQATAARPLGGCAVAQSGCAQLPNRHNAMLACRESRELHLWHVDFVSYMATKSTAPRIRPPPVARPLLELQVLERCPAGVGGGVVFVVGRGGVGGRLPP